jgi:hypothetical protein
MLSHSGGHDTKVEPSLLELPGHAAVAAFLQGRRERE